jgi:hypothetical protein
MKWILLILSLPFFMSACKVAKSPLITKNSTGKVNLVFKACIDRSVFSQDSCYTTPKGDTFSVHKIKFFVSEVALSSAANSESKPVTDKLFNSTFLVDLSTGEADTISLQFNSGEFSDLRFAVGVPRELNHQDPSSAPPPLDLGNQDMFWEWNSGYIFFLLDGKIKARSEHLLHLAIGNDSRWMPFSFGNLFDREPLLRVNSSKPSTIVITVDLWLLFLNGDGSPYSFSTVDHTVVHNGHQADVLRNNLLRAVRVEVLK